MENLLLNSVVLEAFVTKDSDGKKSYCKGKVVKWAVEVGTFTFDLLLSSLSTEVSWRCMEM